MKTLPFFCSKINNPFIFFVPEWKLFEFRANFSEQNEVFKDFNRLFEQEFSDYEILPNSIFHFRLKGIQNNKLEFLNKFFEKISESENPKVHWYLSESISKEIKIEAILPEALRPYQEIIQVIPYEKEELYFDKIRLLLLSKNPADRELAFQLLESQNKINQVYLQELILKTDNSRAVKYLIQHRLFEFLTIQLPTLELDLSKQQLRDIPKEVFRLKGLKSLNLSHNPMTEISKGLFELDTLEMLDLSYTNLQNLPREITLLENLKSLNISHTPLEKLPDNLDRLSHLENLELIQTQIPDNLLELSQIKTLTHLSINEKQVQKLSIEVFQRFQNLKRLFIAPTALILTLPKAIRESEQLKTIEPLFIEEHEDEWDYAFPNIQFNPFDGNLLIEGRTIASFAWKLFDPVLEWIEQYSKYPAFQTKFIFELKYFNTSDSKGLLELMKKASNMSNAKVVWKYYENDEDMEQAGKEFSELVKIPFEFQKY